MWYYDDYRWWMYAIHLASRGVVGCQELESLDVPTSGSPDYSAYAERYGRVLDRLRKDDLHPQAARNLLFCAKALKKWKLADRETADLRRRTAHSGFVERNLRAADKDLPQALIQRMRIVLDQWLPRVEPSELVIQNWSTGSLIQERITGHFGPGSCAEKWSHPKRYERLFRWCSSDMHWPEVPAFLHDATKTSCRLSAVPKEATKDRLITVEPAYASFVQQYVRSTILCSVHAGPLMGTSMDIGFVDSQRVQRGLALKASKNKNLATLDLKDGSDLIPWHLVQQVFPSWVLDLLWISRSTEYHSDICDCRAPMHIYAGMGNATTFIVETLFFSALVRAYAYLHHLPGYVSTFGDDVICSSITASALIQEQFSAFVINQEKSFVGSDALRESCGIFAYKGVDITVPKVDGYLNTYEGAEGISDLHRRLRNMRSALFERLAFLIAKEKVLNNLRYEVVGFPTISDPHVAWSAEPKARWNSKYQRWEVAGRVHEPSSVGYKADWKVARRFNQPQPEVWYYAALARLLSGGSGRRPEHGPSTFRFPNGKFKWKKRWFPITIRNLAAPRGAAVLSYTAPETSPAE